MSLNWTIVGDKLYGILASAGYGVQMRDKNGMATMDPHNAIRFLAIINSKDSNLSTFNILIGLHDEGAYSHLDFRTPKKVNDEDFKIITNIKNSIQKNLGDVEGLKINWTPFGNSITLKDDPIKKVTESKDISKVYGTTKSSFQRVGESKLIIRHTDIVDESKQGARWRKIKAVFIETKDGERFKYPYLHISGARALARHLSEGGSINDVVGQSISCMSEDYIQLKHANKLLRNFNKPDDAKLVKESMKKLNHSLRRLSSPRGYRNVDTMLAKHNDHNIQFATNKTKQFLTDCNCIDGNDSKALTTAAKYIVQIQLPNVVSDNKIPTWLNTMLQKIASKLSDSNHIDRINSMYNNIQNGNLPEQDDIQWAINITKMLHTLPVNSNISRIKQLSGI